MNPVDVTISSFTYFILPNINDDLIQRKSDIRCSPKDHRSWLPNRPIPFKTYNLGMIGTKYHIRLSRLTRTILHR